MRWERRHPVIWRQRHFKPKKKVTDVLEGKTSKSEDFTPAYLLNVTHVFGEMSSPDFHLFCRGSKFQHRSACEGQSSTSQSLCATTRSSHTAKLQQGSKNTLNCMSSWKSPHVFLANSSHSVVLLHYHKYLPTHTFTQHPYLCPSTAKNSPPQWHVYSSFRIFFLFKQIAKKKKERQKQTHNVKCVSASRPVVQIFTLLWNIAAGMKVLTNLACLFSLLEWLTRIKQLQNSSTAFLQGATKLQNIYSLFQNWQSLQLCKTVCCIWQNQCVSLDLLQICKPTQDGRNQTTRNWRQLSVPSVMSKRALKGLYL